MTTFLAVIAILFLTIVSGIAAGRDLEQEVQKIERASADGQKYVDFEGSVYFVKWAVKQAEDYQPTRHTVGKSRHMERRAEVSKILPSGEKERVGLPFVVDCKGECNPDDDPLLLVKRALQLVSGPPMHK